MRQLTLIVLGCTILAMERLAVSQLQVGAPHCWLISALPLVPHNDERGASDRLLFPNSSWKGWLTARWDLRRKRRKSIWTMELGRRVHYVIAEWQCAVVECVGDAVGCTQTAFQVLYHSCP